MSPSAEGCCGSAVAPASVPAPWLRAHGAKATPGLLEIGVGSVQTTHESWLTAWDRLLEIGRAEPKARCSHLAEVARSTFGAIRIQIEHGPQGRLESGYRHRSISPRRACPQVRTFQRDRSSPQPYGHRQACSPERLHRARRLDLHCSAGGHCSRSAHPAAAAGACWCGERPR